MPADLSLVAEAAFLGALAGERSAGSPAGADDLFAVAESVVLTQGMDEDELRHRGMGVPSRAGPAGVLMRVVPFALLDPGDRPLLRRRAYRMIVMSGADSGAAITGIALALLIADLIRFDLSTACLRVRQSLLEEAPLGLLDRLAPRPDAAPAGDADPGGALQIAITMLNGRAGVPETLEGFAEGDGLTVSRCLAGVLAGVRDRRHAMADEWAARLPHAEPALALARRLAVIASTPAVHGGRASS